ncbi:Deoxyxylulose-5-phosphate synthase like protein, partial [Aduncisulcus paluster]
QHAVTMAAGLAAEGIKPVFAVYSTFLQRAYDQIIHDVCLQNLPVVFAIDRAGLVGNDGETHHGVFDLSFLSHIPNMTVLAPKDGPELERMLTYAVEDHKGPIAIRYPRGSEVKLSETSEDILSPEVLKEGRDVTILAVGNMVQTALEAADILKDNGLEATVVNARRVYPLPKNDLLEIIRKYESKYIVTLEDNVIESGFGSSVSSLASEENASWTVQSLGIPNKFVEHGNVDKLMASLGLKLEKAIKEYGVSVEGKICMDIGASTGGFTDCMLQNGAVKVYSVDVGYGQLDWKLRNDERVVNMERTNIRHVTGEDIEDKIDFVSIDVSFISLKLVLPVAYALMADQAEIVFLIKPQFEA